MERSKPSVPESEQPHEPTARERKVNTNREKYPEIAEGIDLIRNYFPNAKIIKITQADER